MKQGAFALLDCLGFKGAWSRHVDPEQIIKFLEQVKASAHETPLVTTVRQDLSNIAPTIVFVSDTVAISTCLNDEAVKDRDLAAGYLVLLASYMAAEISTLFSRAPIPFLFRGTITYGRHIARDSFLLGPAVDESATLSETAQGAFVWLDPGAQALLTSYRLHHERQVTGISQLLPHERVQLINKSFASLLRFTPTLEPGEMRLIVDWWNRLTPEKRDSVSTLVLTECWRPTRDDYVVMDYPVEMKGGGTLSVPVVNPLFRIRPSEHDAWIDAVLASFTGTALDVMMKKQNTERFLRVASQQTKEAVSVTRRNVAAAIAEAERITGVKLRLA